MPIARAALAEPASELSGGGCGLLEHVVEQAGNDHFVRLAVAEQQPAHFDRVHDERRMVRPRY